MKIFQVKYKAIGNEYMYLYYKAEKEQDFQVSMNLYTTYTDCRDEINPMDTMDIEKIKKMLFDRYRNK